MEKFELSGACFAGSSDHHVGYLIGGMNGTRIVSTAFTMDFSKKAPYTWGRANGLINHRHRHKCGMIKVKKTYGKSRNLKH